MDAIRTTVAESWHHLCDVLFENSWRPDLGRHRSPYAFKGLSCVGYEVTSSLTRLGGEAAAVERHLLRNFRKYAIQSVDRPPEGRIWNWLALAQHHGLPTRLVDWSYSPLVALHFATVGHHPSQDCTVMAVDFAAAHRRLPKKLQKALESEGGDVWTADLLEEVVPTLDDLEKLGDGEPLLLFFEPPAIDQRILNQYAFFGVLSDARARMQDYLQAHPELAFRVVIPAALRQEVRDKLDQANVNERVLFPGLDGLSQWLARHYSPGVELPRDAQNRSLMIDAKQETQ
ncbi:FRG domain-containing protein [bacterium]|nr:MAG: FRG domain-containing protein [bacterium]